jgi:hypothetical protein
VTLDNVTRVEMWSMFDAPAEGGDPEYTLISNRATLGARVRGARFDVQGAFRYAQLLGIPRHTQGAGPLGPGAMYFAATRTAEAYQLYITSMSLAVKDIVPGLSVQGGRMPYMSGAGTPFAGRLVGTAEWTAFERAFDGVRVDLGRAGWRAHGSFLMPTQGTFEESGSPPMSRVRVGTASWTARHVELFAHTYRDTRPITVRPDNSGRAAIAVDVAVHTAGASVVAPWVRGWAAWQRGRWYSERHDAFSGTLHAVLTRDTPHARSLIIGVDYASGDDDATDGEHNTFFAMVPTTTPDALRGAFARMNVRDVFARGELALRRTVRVVAAVHHMSLATARDRWYSGTGAAASRGSGFGFTTRGSRLATRLGTVVETSVAASFRPTWNVSASLVSMHAGPVLRRHFRDGWGHALLFESRVRVPD